MKIKCVRCLFEQSGTFKNAFKKYGIKSYDYDILNDFGETDFVIDLFAEIEKAYKGENSIFDGFEKEDLLFAFFPCVRFENQILMHFKGVANRVKDWSIGDKLKYDLRLFDELHQMYSLVTKLVLFCLEKNLRLIIENPYSTQHALTRYWALEPSIIDEDRRFRGDYFKKPTQYYFVNCKPSYRFIFECLINPKPKKVALTSDKVERSLISSVYADRFVREFVLDDEDIKDGK